jgi:hypothetical protein
MQGKGGDIHLRNIIDADRRGGGHCCHIGREVLQSASVKHMVGGERGDLAGRAVDADLRPYLERMAFDAALELLIGSCARRTGLPGKNIAASAT